MNYCANLVRTHDYDRYLCALFAPPAVRAAWCVLFAFNHEIASIAEIVSEEMIGYIRLAWWREALDEIYAGKPVRKHPVAEALAEVIHRYDLPRSEFDMLLQARAHDFQTEPFADMAALTEYCRNTSATLLRLCAIVAKVPVSEALDELGTGWAFAGLARSAKENLPASFAELATQAKSHLEKAREVAKIFRPFLRVARFYTRRLEANKSTARWRVVMHLLF